MKEVATREEIALSVDAYCADASPSFFDYDYPVLAGQRGPIGDTMNAEQEETPLAGGNISTVVRVGDTVRRQVHPWSAAVHGLLRHLETQGFDGAPRFLGVDDHGREILAYIPGEVGVYPLPAFMWSDESLIGAARLLRRLHDATVGYSPRKERSGNLCTPITLVTR